MRMNSFVFVSVIVGSASLALASGCSSAEDPNALTSDQQATAEDLRRHCTQEGEQSDRCTAYKQAQAHQGEDDGKPAPTSTGTTTAPPPPPPPPPPTTTTTAPPPPPPPPSPVTCTSFTYSAWGACQSNSTQTRTVASSSPAGCTGGSPMLSQACTYVAPIDGAALYASDCAGCHGNGKKGSPAVNIQNAINNNTGGMGSATLKALSAAQIAAISAAP